MSHIHSYTSYIVHTSIHTFTYTYIATYIYTSIQSCIHSHMLYHICVYIHTYMLICIGLHRSIHTYNHTYKHITYMYIPAYILFITFLSYVGIHTIHPLIHGLSARWCPMFPHFLTR